jgi:PAS domain S-box-containing protein
MAELMGSYWIRIQADAELKKSEERFRILFEHAPDAYYLNDMEGFFVDGNRAAEELVGYERTELIGKNMLQLNLLAEEELPKAAEGLAQNLQGLPAEISDLVLRRKDGSEVVVDIRAYPVELEGQKMTLGIARDITERKRAERERDTLEEHLRQLQKMEAIGRLAGGVAHEINNPLGVILGFAQSVAKRLEDGDPLEMPLRSIEREALRCKALVKDLLAFSRRSSGVFEPVRITDLLSTTETLLRNQARLQEIEFVTRCEPDLPELLADFNRLQQVLVNLATNAIDAMPQGGTLRIEAGKDNGDMRLIVSDTGLGMADEVRQRIFEPFFTTKEVGKGTGLGLSLVYEIMQQHGGEVHCDSRPGAGTTFTLLFPSKTNA